MNELLVNRKENGQIRIEAIINDEPIYVDNFVQFFGIEVGALLNFDKHELRAMLLNVAYVNDDGIVCDHNQSPIEDEDFNLVTPEGRPPYMHISFYVEDETGKIHPGGNISNDTKKRCRQLNCIRIYPQNNPINKNNDTFKRRLIFVTEESVELLQALVYADIMHGDEGMNNRYFYEVTHNSEFAKKFSDVVYRGMRDLRKKNNLQVNLVAKKPANHEKPQLPNLADMKPETIEALQTIANAIKRYNKTLQAAGLNKANRETFEDFLNSIDLNEFFAAAEAIQNPNLFKVANLDEARQAIDEAMQKNRWYPH